MAEQSTHERSDLIRGQVLRSDERGDAVLFLREGTLWVADCRVNGECELFDAATWVRFNCGGAAGGRARLSGAPPPLSVYQLARIKMLVHGTASGPSPTTSIRRLRTPLSAELVARVEYLHRLIAVDEAPFRSSN
jgi:hypothetical protein